MSKKSKHRKKAHRHKLPRKPPVARKSEKGSPRCESCGESDRKIQTVVLQVSGRERRRWRYCRMCTAVLDVLLSDHRRRRL